MTCKESKSKRETKAANKLNRSYYKSLEVVKGLQGYELFLQQN